MSEHDHKPKPRGSGYFVSIVPVPQFDSAGLSIKDRSWRWREIERVLCADVGEPEGVRTIVFDVVLCPGLDDEAASVLRFDADPGPSARAIAAAFEVGLGSKLAGADLRELAKDGTTSRWYPDLESLGEANVEALSRTRC